MNRAVVLFSATLYLRKTQTNLWMLFNAEHILEKVTYKLQTVSK